MAHNGDMDVFAFAVMMAVDPVPEPEDVRAGWTALWVVIAMAVATGLLSWSLTRQLRKTRDNAARGAFGDVEDVEDEDAGASTQTDGRDDLSPRGR